jgi:hypothetical protein
MPTALQEMASEERKAADSKIVEENFHNSLGAEEQQAETDAFQCGRCKQVCLYPALRRKLIAFGIAEKMPLQASADTEC